MKAALASLFVLLAGTARANWGGPDATLSGTQLIPYFEVDASPAGRVTTHIWVEASYATAELAHVIIWSDQGVPVFQLDLYLPGYDVALIDLRMLLAYGVYPTTATSGGDPGDVISPKGHASQDINLSSCNDTLPAGSLSEPERLAMVDALRGQPSARFDGACVASPSSDGLVRGYVTISTTFACRELVPGQGEWRDVVTYKRPWLAASWSVSDGQGHSFGDTAAALELAYAFGSPFYFRTWVDLPDGTPTFWGRSLGWHGDNTEAIGPRFALPFATPAASSLIVWREPRFPSAPFPCASPPAPLGVQSLEAWDLEGQLTSITTNPFPRATQRVPLSALGALPSAGTLTLDLRAPEEHDGPASEPTFRNAWVVGVVQTGTSAEASAAIQLPREVTP